MRSIFLFLLVFAFCFSVQAQTHFNDSLANSRIKLTRQAMLTLGAWSVVNISSGFILANQTSGETKYFWRMNAYWNFINLGLAGLAYAGTQKMMLHHYSLAENTREQYKMEKLYLFNLGLDLFYIAGGFYLRERGLSEPTQDKKDQLRGYGTSIIAQGGFLLLMDAVMYSLHHRNTIRVNKKLEQLELSAGPGWASLVYRF